ncbi:hypothetical protein MKZ38_006734 [Zalerion maritima]|uniref:aldehyde dehydrogenase (NAD(+)) n=1 Tax=Zalerion maritima TaxID=339359 RepID=A0AAD5RIK6_9PEZI|nr:hypothetical protein MKZ38_006734 [Zalerion maritima]
MWNVKQKDNSGTMPSSFPWNKDNLPKKLFIDNEYVDSKNPKILSSYSPKDNSLIASDIALGNEVDVDAAVAAGEAAFATWKKTLPSKRRDLLNKFADLIEANGETLAHLSRINLGAPYAAFGAFEVNLCAEAFRYFAGWCDKFAGESYPQEDGFMKIVRNEPLGVTVGILPWNAPLGGIGFKAGPALASGNCFILKPSEKSPFAPLALGWLIKEAGFPPGVFQVISGDGATGALFASHMKVRKISFTGSTGTGRRIQEMAAKSNLKRVTLELGGKSPALVFDDANLDNAVTWCVNGITGNTGQVCFAASRVYVQEGVFGKFLEKYKAAMEERGRAIGDPDKEGTLMGPLIDQMQFERGFYIEPTVFTNVAEDSEICTQEIFGPVAILNSFKTEEEILAKANATNFGLMAGVFTQDINRAMRVSSEIDSGMVGINCVSLCFLQAPFGGSKESGQGRENAIHAMRMFTEPKTIMINLTY